MLLQVNLIIPSSQRENVLAKYFIELLQDAVEFTLDADYIDLWELFSAIAGERDLDIGLNPSFAVFFIRWVDYS